MAPSRARHARRRPAATRSALIAVTLAGGLATTAQAAQAAPVPASPVTAATLAGHVTSGTAVPGVGTRLLRFGSRGAAVAYVQRRVGTTADGIFGPRTRAAVKRFQRAHGLVADGIVGPRTWRALGAAKTSARTTPRASRSAPRAPITSRSGIPARVAALNWAALARCESGGNPAAVNPAGYYGLYQFDVRTWRSVGGSGMPHHASRAEQTYRAQRLYMSRGRSPWPVCGRHL